MNCPDCGEEGAYVGIIHIECANHDCKFYSSKQWEQRIDTALDSLLDENSSDPDKTPVYPIQLGLFGPADGD